MTKKDLINVRNDLKKRRGDCTFVTLTWKNGEEAAIANRQAIEVVMAALLKELNRQINELSFEEKIKSLFAKYNCHYDYSAFNGEVEIYVRWGDWKHDHLFLNTIMREAGFVLVDEITTEEDGSDCYSSTHKYREGKE